MSTEKMVYPIPAGMHAIPPEQLDMRPDSEIDKLILNPAPVTSEKNVWFYWHAGFAGLHPYAQRNIRAWHRRFAPRGWTIRVVDIEESRRSPGHISNWLDTSNPELFPKAFHENRIDGEFRGQLTSDLTRFPLLLVHGGIYADVTVLQIGDIDALWNATCANSSSPYDFLLHNFGGKEDVRVPFNYFMGARPGNPYVQRCQSLLIKLWAEDGGRTNTYGLFKSPLMKEAPRLDAPKGPETEGFNNSGKFEEMAAGLSDYGLQMMVMTLVAGLIDPEDGWNGPEYAAKNMFPLDFIAHAGLMEVLKKFDGMKIFNLLSLSMSKDGEDESAEQQEAREMVEKVFATSFSVKLAHGPIAKLWGTTLGLQWRYNEGSDDVPGTYAHWLRYGMIHWCQDKLPERMDYELREPFKVGPLLRVVDDGIPSPKRHPLDHAVEVAESIQV